MLSRQNDPVIVNYSISELINASEKKQREKDFRGMGRMKMKKVSRQPDSPHYDRAGPPGPFSSVPPASAAPLDLSAGQTPPLLPKNDDHINVQSFYYVYHSYFVITLYHILLT